MGIFNKVLLYFDKERVRLKSMFILNKFLVYHKIFYRSKNHEDLVTFYEKMYKPFFQKSHFTLSTLHKKIDNEILKQVLLNTFYHLKFYDADFGQFAPKIALGKYDSALDFMEKFENEEQTLEKLKVYHLTYEVVSFYLRKAQIYVFMQQFMEAKSALNLARFYLTSDFQSLSCRILMTEWLIHFQQCPDKKAFFRELDSYSISDPMKSFFSQNQRFILENWLLSEKPTFLYYHNYLEEYFSQSQT